MEEWLRQIIEARGLTVSEARRDLFLDDVRAVIRLYEATHVTADNDRWRGILGRPISITRQDESPFDLLELIRIAQKRLILIAQNHGLMTISDGHEKFEEIIFGKLTLPEYLSRYSQCILMPGPRAMVCHCPMRAPFGRLHGGARLFRSPNDTVLVGIAAVASKGKTGVPGCKTKSEAHTSCR